MSHRVFQSENGMSLTSILVVVAILGVITTALSSLLIGSINNQMVIQQKQSVHTLQMSLTEVLSSAAVCQSNFNDPTATPARKFIINDPGYQVTIPSIKNGSTEIFKLGDRFENDSLELKEIRLMNWRPRVAKSAAKDPDEYKGAMDVVFNFQRVLANSNGLPSLSRTVSLAVELGGFTASNLNTPNEWRIENCVALGNDSNQPWRVTAAGDILYESGNVGIGISSPTQRLQVNGYVLANGYLYPSDARLKRDISPSPGLELIEKLQGVHYRRMQDLSPAYGVIAQDMEKIMPSAVLTDPTTGMKSVDYLQIIAPLIESTKQLQQQVKDNSQKLEANKDLLQRLKRQLPKARSSQ